MGQFFKFMFASCLGVILATFLLFGIGSLIFAGLASQAEKPREVKPNSILHLTLDQTIPEKTNNLEMPIFDLQNRKVLGLHEIIQTLEQARADDNIKGILLEVDMLATSGIVTATDLREALLEFRESGKFIVSYSKYYTQGAYYLASAADEIYLNPTGLIDFRGFGVQIPFFKKMLDKFGVEMQIFYAGKFKSATEPYRLTGMSEESRLQTREYLQVIYADFLRDISESRGVPSSQLDAAAGDYLAGTPEGALQARLIDSIGHREDALGAVRRRLGLKDDDKIPAISLGEYNRSHPPKTNFSTRDKIAVVFAEGTIVDGEGDNGSIGDQRYVDIIRELRRDERVKAIVVRVNSPGGSALASENIWHELTLAKKAGKPVIVSMGDYAASGGYYIASAADSIFAEAKTLTGSIGVFSIIPNANRLLDEKLGITFDTVKTTDFGVGITPFMDLTEEESRFLQRRTEQMYETFLKRVSDGRGMSRDSVDAIAQGRVWTGDRARQLGLVDRIAPLDEAVRAAAAMAGIADYRLSEYPRVKDPLQQLLENLTGTSKNDDIAARLRNQLPEYAPYIRYVEELRQARGVQARLPFIFAFN